MQLLVRVQTAVGIAGSALIDSEAARAAGVAPLVGETCFECRMLLCLPLALLQRDPGAA